MGQRASDTRGITLEDVEVPDAVCVQSNRKQPSLVCVSSMANPLCLSSVPPYPHVCLLPGT